MVHRRSLLHRCIRSGLVSWAVDCHTARPVLQEGGAWGREGEVTRLLQGVEVCLGAGEGDSWGRGVGWGCLRRKCVAVALVLDLGASCAVFNVLNVLNVC